MLDLEVQMVDSKEDTNDGLPPFLVVQSQVRKVATRTLRARSPGRARFKQYLFGDQSLRLVRKRPLKVATARVLQNIKELAEKEAVGILSVHLPGGERLDLAALATGHVSVTKSMPAPPLPHPPLDSIANDIPAGEPRPQYVDGTFPGDPAAERTLERMTAEKQAELARQERTASEPPPPPPADEADPWAETDPSPGAPGPEGAEHEGEESEEAGSGDPAAERSSSSKKSSKKSKRSP